MLWPLLTALALIGYRRYQDGRLHEARVALSVYSLTGLSTLAHFIYGVPKIPAFFFATIFADGITGAAVLLFALLAIRPAPAVHLAARLTAGGQLRTPEQ